MDALNHVAPGIASVSKIATVDPSRGVIADGIAESPFTYLVKSRPITVSARSQLVAVGELFSGGLTVGVLKDNEWSQSLNVTKPGRFIAAVEVPADGTYVAVLANVNEDVTRPTRFVISGLDWWAPPSTPAAGGR